MRFTPSFTPQTKDNNMHNMTDLEREIIDYTHEAIEEIHGYSPEKLQGNIDFGDLHHELFNTSYYIVGTYNAKQWLGSLAFDVIDVVRTYEYEQFGEYYTDVSDPEKVVNMYVYIIGEECIRDVVENFLSTLTEE